MFCLAYWAINKSHHFFLECMIDKLLYDNCHFDSCEIRRFLSLNLALLFLYRSLII